MKKIIFTLMMAMSLNAWSGEANEFETIVDDSAINTNFSVSWHQTDHAVYIAQQYRDKYSNQFIIATQRITFDEKDQIKNSEVMLQTKTGLKVFSAKKLVDELEQQKSTGTTTAELEAFIEIMGNPMVTEVGELLALQQNMNTKRGACGAATSYVAFTWSQFVSAVIAGNNSAANYWMFENSWAISEMRIFCEIQ